MSYQVNRALGYQRWGVTNPWVFANFAQPQRQRGRVSPVVFQTQGPFLKSAHLGETPDEELRRAQRMEIIAVAGLGMSAMSLWMAYQFYSKRGKVTPNRRRRRRTR